MIKLDVRDYCQECPDFEADVNRNVITGPFDELIECNTVIQCENRIRCESIIKYLMEQYPNRDDRTCETSN